MKTSHKPLIIANWKMNPATEKEAIQLFRATKKGISRNKKIELVIAPPAVFLSALKREKGITLGAQDMSMSEIGAYTGQISGKMLRDLGVKYVIVGHSEMRHPPVGGGETNGEVARKVSLALKLGLTPVVCVGERVRDESGKFFNDVKEQLRESLAGVSKSGLLKLVIAYEPIWAIGKNAPRAATPHEAQEMILFVRKTLAEIAVSKKILSTKVIYGASVDEKNALELLATGAEGLLPGRISLDSKKFIKMLENLTTYNA